MRKALLLPLLAILAAAVLAVPALAGTGTASSRYPYSETQAGTSVTATFNATSKNQGYTLEVFDSSGVFAVCREDIAPYWDENGRKVSPSGPQVMTCTMPAGTYTASFWPTKGSSVQVTLTWG